jgi:succinate dehydrogenase / fumarate reductase iron-sulfur subunit
MKTFPHVKDLVTDVSWNYRVKMKIQKFVPRPADAPDGTWRVQQADVDRPQEFRKCIECFLCQDVCHVLRDHDKHDEFIGPRFLIYAAQLEMNPIDSGDLLKALKDDFNIGYCNITKCCTKVCPEEIKITDNAIIPLKERIVDEYYDPLGRLIKIFKRLPKVNPACLEWAKGPMGVHEGGYQDGGKRLAAGFVAWHSVGDHPADCDVAEHRGLPGIEFQSRSGP